MKKFQIIISAVSALVIVGTIGATLSEQKTLNNKIVNIQTVIQNIETEITTVSTERNVMQEKVDNLEKRNAALKENVEYVSTTLTKSKQKAEASIKNAKLANTVNQQNEIKEVSQKVKPTTLPIKELEALTQHFEKIAADTDKLEAEAIEAKRIADAKAAAEKAERDRLAAKKAAEKKAAEKAKAATKSKTSTTKKNTNNTAPSAKKQDTKSANKKPAAKKPAPKNPAPKPAGDAWLNEFRTILNKFGGSGVTLVELKGTCAGSRNACSGDNGVIYIGKPASYFSNYEKHWLVMHEYAHQFQFRNWGKIMSSKKYQSLMGGNIEKMANCMAASRGYPSPRTKCTKAQTAWAGKVWNNVVE